MKNLIQAKLAAYPSAGLSVEPTPLYALPRLSARLERRVYILREDLTGFGLGGNKVRKLDYLIGDALAKRADVLLTRGACSFSRNASVAGKMFGLDVHVLIPAEESEHNAASRALFEQVEATLHHGSECADVLERLESAGRVVYELPPGGSDPVGALGYVRVFDQIVAYSAATGVHFDKIVVPTGSTATQVGLLLGQSITGYATSVIAVAISQKADVQRRRVLDLAVSTAAMLGTAFDESSLRIDDDFLGDGYAEPSAAGQAAVRTFAHLEGVLLDQVYTGKAAAALIHYAAAGRFADSDNILFIHTGGNFGLFY
ncbi:MAG: pyridoxal-phosphate dependent enzyme [bacterium]|nr:pyridoxal-phosphate dependent enzyme [bacterium]